MIVVWRSPVYVLCGAIALGLIAALMHRPIDDRPMARMTEGA